MSDTRSLAFTIGLASPEVIRNWSSAEIRTHEDLDNWKANPASRVVFGEQSLRWKWGYQEGCQCLCGRYQSLQFIDKTCETCGVKVTRTWSQKRQLRHIELVVPVVHIWFFKSMPNVLGQLLNLEASILEQIIYCHGFVVLNPGDTALKKGQLLTWDEAHQAKSVDTTDSIKMATGAEAIGRLLAEIDLNQISHQLKSELTRASNTRRRQQLSKRLDLVDSWHKSESRPEWMVLNCLPVIPPDHRLPECRRASPVGPSDLTELYHEIVKQNLRLKELIDHHAAEQLIIAHKRLLQQAVDGLLDNEHAPHPIIDASNRRLNSLADAFDKTSRHTPSSKRVDFSARSVVVVDPGLELHQCGLPFEIAVKLYHPFIIRRMIELGRTDSIEHAERMLERPIRSSWPFKQRSNIAVDELWEMLNDVIIGRPVFLSRRHQIQRAAMQAFEPKIVVGNAIRINPVVCKCFDINFEGEQVNVHLPLSIEAQTEATTLMMAKNNLFSPSDGTLVIGPSQDIVMGCYYLTLKRLDQPGEGLIFSSAAEVHTAFQNGQVTLHSSIRFRLKRSKGIEGDGSEDERTWPFSRLETTVGRVLFNDILQPEMPFYNKTLKSHDLAKIICANHLDLGNSSTSRLLDEIKGITFQVLTRSGLSFALSDLPTSNGESNSKARFIADAEKQVLRWENNFSRGNSTRMERYHGRMHTWTETRDKFIGHVMQNFHLESSDDAGYINPVYVMAESGTQGVGRGIRMLSGIYGITSKPSGEWYEVPIKSNFREGLSAVEYFMSAQRTRRESVDKTSKSSRRVKLTKKLADACENVVITSHDCGTRNGVTRQAIYRGDRVEMSLLQAIRGRVSRQEIRNPITDELIVRKDEMITDSIAKKIEEMGFKSIPVRSPMTCEAKFGVCELCYGMDLSTGLLAERGLAVGMIAAQSLGEPSRELVSRIYDLGYPSTDADGEIKSRRGGQVRFARLRHVTNDYGESIVIGEMGEICIVDGKERELERFSVPHGATLQVGEGSNVNAGQVLSTWNVHGIPTVSEVGGKVRFQDLIEGKSVHQRHPNEYRQSTVLKQNLGLHPRILLEDSLGKIVEFYYLNEQSIVNVSEGQQVSKGTVLADSPRRVTSGGIRDFIGGYPELMELFEAKPPKWLAILAAAEGEVADVSNNDRGDKVIVILSDDGNRNEYTIPYGRGLRCFVKDRVSAGEPLTYGEANAHDILHICGEEAVQNHLLEEIRLNYQVSHVPVDVKHIEIVLSQMLRWVQVDDPRDTNLRSESLVDRVAFQRVNQELASNVRVTDPGNSGYSIGDVIPRATMVDWNRVAAATNRLPMMTTELRPAEAAPKLLGLRDLAALVDSSLWRATKGDAAKVLKEAAAHGQSASTVGLKESRIVGTLIPAGTGFRDPERNKVHRGLDEVDNKPTPDELYASAELLIEKARGRGSRVRYVGGPECSFDKISYPYVELERDDSKAIVRDALGEVFEITSGSFASIVLNIDRVIDRLPPSLGGLSKLEFLSLGVNFYRYRADELVCSELVSPGFQGTDLSPLATLTSLTRLDLEGCPAISDLSPLSHLKSLQTLNLSRCPLVSELSPLAGLTGLGALDLQGDLQIRDLTPLGQLTSLRTLSLSARDLPDYLSPLAALTSLQTLDLQRLGFVNDLRPLRHTTSLQTLTLSGKTLPDLLPLSALTRLQKLNLSFDHVKNLLTLKSLRGLESLELNFCCQLSDLTPLSSLTTLKSLALRGCERITDLAPLGNLTSLETLTLGDLEQVSFTPIRPLLGSLRELILYRTRFTDIGEQFNRNYYTNVIDEVRNHFLQS